RRGTSPGTRCRSMAASVPSDDRTFRRFSARLLLTPHHPPDSQQWEQRFLFTLAQNRVFRHERCIFTDVEFASRLELASDELPAHMTELTGRCSTEHRTENQANAFVAERTRSRATELHVKLVDWESMR